MADRPLCISCKHHHLVPVGIDGGVDMCLNPKNQVKSYVTGEVTESRMCNDINFNGLCRHGEVKDET